MTGFQRLCLVTALATYALIVLGGVVRASESGLGCPDWPQCHGQVAPVFQKEALIEYSHRAAALVVSILIAATAIMAWRRHRAVPSIFVPSSLALGLLIVQVLVGGVTVMLELPPEVVALHLALAIALLGILTIGSVTSFLPRATGTPNGGNISGLAAFAALATFGLIVTGAYVTGSDAGLVFSDWPLFNGKIIPEGGQLQQIHFLHRFAAAGVGFILALLATTVWRYRHRFPALIPALVVALVLYLAQVFVGASNVWFRLDPTVRVAHLALAVALWGTLVALATISFRSSQHWAKVASTPVPGQPGGMAWR